ncbi:MAG: hypothetical protein R3Y53_11660 [Bacillota bacterium]
MKKINILLAMSIFAMGFVGCGTANNLRDATDSYGYSYEYQDRYGLDNNYYDYGTGSYNTGSNYGTGSYNSGSNYGNYNSYNSDLGYSGSTRGGNAYWDGYGINAGRDIENMFDSSFDTNSMLN